MKVVVGKDLELTCQICKYADLEERNALLNTPALTFLDLDWLNKSAKCFVCRRCGYVHWFLLRTPKPASPATSPPPSG